MILHLPNFKTRKELFEHIVKHEEDIFAQAKMKMKEADGLGHYPLAIKGSDVEKSHSVEDLLAKESLQTKLAINTTNVIDSHLDMHMPGLWAKSLKESKRILHLQEHSRKFQDVISKGSNLRAYTETRTWESLGFSMEGKTQVLTFDSNILKSQNQYMFEQYAKGNVDEHSVGMLYVKMVTCIDDDDFPVQQENFEKYIKECANPEVVKAGKLFWAVLEAKAIEGSAVTLGSNSFTPTIDIKEEIQSFTDEEIKGNAIKEWLQK